MTKTKVSDKATGSGIPVFGLASSGHLPELGMNSTLDIAVSKAWCEEWLG
jgi:hypothetical protein